MKIFNKNLTIAAIVMAFMFVVSGFIGSPAALAATTPSLGTADTFGVLVNTFSRLFSGTAITGDLGYTTFSGTGTYTVSGQTHVADSPYNQAVTDQGTTLTALNNQACDFTFTSGSGPIDLATDTTHTAYGGALGVYTPGVYCLPAAYGATIGAAGITLSGSGTYIFRINGSLTTAANSVVTLDGASACNVFWTLADNAIISNLGAYSTFFGTLFDTVSLQLHNNVTWTGRAFLTSGSVSISYDDVITAPTSCTTPPPSTTGTIHVIKHVINDDGGTDVAADFNLHVKGSGGMGLSEVAGSPAAGMESPGVSYTLTAGIYAVSEDTPSDYTQSFSGDCDSHGNITLVSGGSGLCTITNNDIAVPHSATSTLQVIKHVINDDGSKEIASDFTLHVKGSGGMGLSEVAGSPAPGVESPGTSYSLTAGTYTVSEDTHSGYTSSFSGDCDSHGNITLVSGGSGLCTITNNDIAIPPVSSHPATLHVIKVVVNDNGGKAKVSEAIVHVMNGVGDVAGSPAAGTSSPGKAYSLEAGTYSVSEDFFPGYTVKIGGDCSDSGTVVLSEGDDKTCTITNNDIAGIVVPPVTVTTSTPPVIATSTCDVCQLLTYDIYIINPDGSERHTGTPWVKVTDRPNGIKRYSFEDATLDPNNILFDHNDSIVDIDLKDCQSELYPIK